MVALYSYLISLGTPTTEKGGAEQCRQPRDGGRLWHGSHGAVEGDGVEDVCGVKISTVEVDEAGLWSDYEPGELARLSGRQGVTDFVRVAEVEIRVGWDDIRP